jgi:hypothetical protein
MSDIDTILQACGGRKIKTGEGGGAWYFGYNPPGSKTAAEELAALAAGDLYRDHIVNEDVPSITGDKVFLWELEKAANKGKLLPRNYQLTGSCVNGGGQNALGCRLAVEALMLKESERVVCPFTLIAYGDSRAQLGMNDEGDGSSGETFALALSRVGFSSVDNPAFPQPTVVPAKGRDDATVIYYPANVEKKFAAARNHTADMKAACKPYTCKFVRCKSADEAEAELRRGRPLTVAGNWGGKTQGLEYKGEPRVLWNVKADTWNHQQSVPGVWRHPTLGRIFCWTNQWYMVQGGVAVPVHGDVTMGEPPCSYWTSEKDLDYQCRTGEVCALEGVVGLPGDIDWLLGV